MNVFLHDSSALIERRGLGKWRVMRRESWVMYYQGRVSDHPYLTHPARSLKRQRLGELRVSEGQIFVTFYCQAKVSMRGGSQRNKQSLESGCDV